MLGLIPLILGIVQDGLKLWSEERRTRFLKRHHRLKKDLEDAKNKIYPDYNDADVDLFTEQLRLYLEAYWSELRKNDVADLQSGKG